MDIVVHQTNNAIYSESEDVTRWTVNDVLQKLITDVEDMLKRDNSDCVDNSSTLQEDLCAKTDQIYYDNLDILMKSSECKSGMNFEPPDQDVSRRNIIYEDNQSDLLRNTELIANSSPEEVHPAVCNEQRNQEGNQNIYSINVDLEDSTNGLSSGGESREQFADDSSESDSDLFYFHSNVLRVSLDALSEDEDTDTANQRHEGTENDFYFGAHAQNANLMHEVFPSFYAMGDNRAYLFDIPSDDNDDDDSE